MHITKQNKKKNTRIRIHTHLTHTSYRYNLRNRFMLLDLQCNVFIRSAEKIASRNQNVLNRLRSDIQSEKDRIREQQRDLNTLKRQICGDIEREFGGDISSLSDPVSSLIRGMRKFSECPVNEKFARKLGDGYCEHIWGAYRSFKTSRLRRGDKVYLFSSFGKTEFNSQGVRAAFSRQEIDNPVSVRAQCSSAKRENLW